MKILINGVPGAFISMDIDPGDTVEGLMLKIRETTGIDIPMQHLNFVGTPLVQGRLLSDYAIEKDSGVMLTLRSKGVDIQKKGPCLLG